MEKISYKIRKRRTRVVLGAGLPLKSLKGLITLSPGGRRSNHLFIRDQRDCGGRRGRGGWGGNSSLGDSRKTRTAFVAAGLRASLHGRAHAHTRARARSPITANCVSLVRCRGGDSNWRQIDSPSASHVRRSSSHCVNSDNLLPPPHLSPPTRSTTNNQTAT